MRLRHQQGEQPVAPVHEHDDGGEERAALLDRGSALLAAADDAINRALSRNSEEFLAQNRQSGGQ
jgi:hypothetical protein